MNQDQELRSNVMQELHFEPRVNPVHLEVTVNDGTVTLTGTVETFAETAAAVRAVQRVRGVHGVANKVRIDLSPLHHRSDPQLMQAALEALRWHWPTPLGGIEVGVEQGWITLNGKVEWEYQRQSAHDAVAHLFGVTGVNNLISITPHLQPSEVESSIKRAFERRLERDAQRVTVTVTDGEVTLTGHLPSWSAREQAVRAAWSAAGVTKVDNQIKIDATLWMGS